MKILTKLFTTEQLELIESNKKVFELAVLESRISSISTEYIFEDISDERITKDELQKKFEKYLATLPDDVLINFSGSFYGTVERPATQEDVQRAAFRRLQTYIDTKPNRLKQYLKLKEEFEHAQDPILGC